MNKRITTLDFNFIHSNMIIRSIIAEVKKNYIILSTI